MSVPASSSDRRSPGNPSESSSDSPSPEQPCLSSPEYAAPVASQGMADKDPEPGDGKASLGKDAAHQNAEKPDAVRLIGAVSHEMRNPLNGILGMAHLLSETELSPSQRSYLEAIETSGGLLLTLVNDLLDLTALQSGAVTVNTSPVSVMQLINQIMELEAPRAHAKQLGLGSVVDPVLAEPIIADPVRLRQVISNLLSNAVKFTRTGGVKLDAWLEGAEAPMLVIDVLDTGDGIAPNDQALIFQPFGRTGAAEASGAEGTGLGLPLSRGLAEAMNGRLDLVTSSMGVGTHMRLSIPLIWADADGEDDRSSTTEDSHASRPLEAKRVLLVVTPDYSSTPETEALCATLSMLGASVDTVSEAARLAGLHDAYDHVLIDITFDYAVLWARLNLPALGLRPVMLVRPSERERLEALATAGFSGYLIRPVRQSSLTAMLTDQFGTRPTDGFLPDPADAETIDPPSDSDASPENEPTRHMLMADDSPVNALLGEAALSRAGYKVTVVTNGAEAVDAMREVGPEGFDGVVLDLTMPVMDGFQAAKAMRALGFEGRIVAVSGTTDPELDRKVEAAGFDAFAVKPIAPDALAALMDTSKLA